MGRYTIRLVGEADAGEVADIYAPYVRETAITFEYEAPTPDEFKIRIEKISAEYPYIVCAYDGKIIGYAYANKLKERAAYKWDAELSVYIDKAHLRGGIGKALYGALMDILRLQNVINVYGGVAVPNTNSEKLHENMGFNRLGTYHKTGYKLGTWYDVAWFEKALGDHSQKPKPFVSIKKLDPETIQEIMKRYCQLLNK